MHGTYSTLGAMISHELISHGGAVQDGGGWNSHAYNRFWTNENEYHVAHDEPSACPNEAPYR